MIFTRIIELLGLVVGLVCNGDAMCPVPCTCERLDELVDCSFRNLESVPNDIQSNVTSINLSGNRLSILGERQFFRFERLGSLDLSNNSIASIHPTAFQSLEYLTQLILTGNQLQVVTSGTFNDTRNLNLLDMSSNQLIRLGADLFHTCISLAQLKLANNRLESAVFTAIEQVPWIQILDLSLNPIYQLPYLGMSRLYELIILELRGCDIADVDTNAFIGLTSLSHLHLNGNQIRAVKREMFQPLGDLAEINLADNAIVCDCGTKQFQDWLLETAVTLRTREPCYMHGGSTTIDIADGSLDFLCGPQLTTILPPPDRSCNTSVTPLTMEAVNVSAVSLRWRKSYFAPGEILDISVRLFSQSDFLFAELVPASWESVIVQVARDSQTGLIACVAASTACETCQEFLIGASTGSISVIVVIAVSSVLGVCIIILLSLLAWSLVQARRRKAQNKKGAETHVTEGVKPPSRVTEDSASTGDNPYDFIAGDHADPRRAVHVISTGYPVAFSNRGYMEDRGHMKLPPAGSSVAAPRPHPFDQYIHPVATVPRGRAQRPALINPNVGPHRSVPSTTCRRPSDHNYEEPLQLRRQTAEYEEPLSSCKLFNGQQLAKSMTALDELDRPIPSPPPHYLALDLDAVRSDGARQLSGYYDKESSRLRRSSGHAELAGDTGARSTEYMHMSGREPSEYMDMRPGSNC